jgi:hypothetical protein
MKTLVIHPSDPSTDFLKGIYKDKDWTIVNDPYITRSRVQITKLIKEHERIIMMGHGYPGGLFYSCITPELVYLLRTKLCVCIWCNADRFVLKYGLRGFYTGMFISEVSEAKYFGIETTQEKIDHSNNYFATELNKYIDLPFVHQLIKEHYNSFDCPVIQFNNDRLYERDEESILAERDWTDDLSEEEQPIGILRGSFNLDGTHI